ncbi:MAG: 23S rRNA (adenine(2503)-C(2))-methyltransferase RlmN [Chitinispirillaceae bacterium]|nr:23S rRNA (adenine(2503)-C(2))-methyltransferase RlmN [Chitinispirillaceae bacterium]
MTILDSTTVEHKTRLKNLTPGEVNEEVMKLGEPSFRGTQLLKWMYQKRVASFDLMTTMSKPLRARLSAVFAIDKMISRATVESKKRDAVKFAFECIESPHYIESVLLYDRQRRTACLSSQLGCGLGCTFCVTGKMGFIRNLTQEEIVGQLIGINDYLAARNDKPVTNIVFMGMGEALSNFEQVRSSLEIIMHPETFNIGGRRITISTAGVIPSIERLMTENLNVGLAISLNAYSDVERSRLMPVNDRYPIASLVEIAKRYFEKTGRRVTFEYVLIAGITDTDKAVAALEQLLNGFPCKVNLIPINPYGDPLLQPPSERRLEWFADELHHRGIAATIRKSRGQDISGACGQLAGGSR